MWNSDILKDIYVQLSTKLRSCTSHTCMYFTSKVLGVNLKVAKFIKLITRVVRDYSLHKFIITLSYTYNSTRWIIVLYILIFILLWAASKRVVFVEKNVLHLHSIILLRILQVFNCCSLFIRRYYTFHVLLNELYFIKTLSICKLLHYFVTKTACYQNKLKQNHVITFIPWKDCSQRHIPVTESQPIEFSWWQSHSCLQPRPYEPCSHRSSHTLPAYPGAQTQVPKTYTIFFQN